MDGRMQAIALQRRLRHFQAARGVTTRSQWHSTSLRAPCHNHLLPRPKSNVFPHKNYRFASTAGPAESSLVARLKNLLLGTSLVLFLGLGWYYVTDTRAGIHRWVVVPGLRWWYRDAEEAHVAGAKALKALWEVGMNPRERENIDGGILEVEIFGQTLVNPIGTSAGIDKHADIPSPLLALGPAIVEIGGTTPHPQDGNPKPRVFRLPSQKALINRYGLNSEGADHIAMRLRERVRQFAQSVGIGIDEEAEKKVLNGEAGVPPGSLVSGRLLAVQIAKNKWTPEKDIEAVKRDYVYCVQQLGKYADIIVVNVSSPNTPGLRTLQRVEPLTRILKGVVDAAGEVPRSTKPKVMVKVSPDEDSEEQVRGICDAVWESGVDGVIVGNTTNRRPESLPQGYIMPDEEVALLSERGGFSGPHLFGRTVALVRRYRKLLNEGPRHIERDPARTDSSSKDSIVAASMLAVGGAPSGDNPEEQVLEKLANNSAEAGATSAGYLVEKKQEEQTSAQTSEKTPHLQEKPGSDSVSDAGARKTLATAASDVEEKSSSPSPLPLLEPKVIFATGGITNGKQALEVLNAGADIAMVYTALVYGGVGTITRIKKEMRDQILGKGKGK